MKYRHLFFDLDHTLWDFDANSRLTLEELYHSMDLASAGVHDFDLFHSSYLVHNDRLWARYRNGYIKVDELRWKRMWHTLLEFRIGDERLAKEMGVKFLELLPSRNSLFPGTIDLLNYLREKNYQLSIITNGFEVTQHAKLRNSKIDHYFKEVITSEGSNSLKPKKEIFDYAFLRTGADPSTSIMIGDGPDVDVLGAINAGIDSVFVNHINANAAIKATYEVKHLDELKLIF